MLNIKRALKTQREYLSDNPFVGAGVAAMFLHLIMQTLFITVFDFNTITLSPISTSALLALPPIELGYLIVTATTFTIMTIIIGGGILITLFRFVMRETQKYYEIHNN